MALMDAVNTIGQNHTLRPVGAPLRWVMRRMSIPALARFAGRRIVSAFATSPAVLLTGLTMREALWNPQLLFMAVKHTVEVMGLDMVCLMADLSLEAEACGCEVNLAERAVPAVVSHPLCGTRDVDQLRVPDPDRDGRMPVFLEAMRLTRRRYTLLVIAEVIGPFTLATQLAGPEAYADTRLNPERMERVLEYCVRVITKYAHAMIRAGADTLMIAEPTVSQLSLADYEKFSSPYVRRIIAAAARPCCLHVCGKAGHLIPSMCESGAQGISVDDVDMAHVIESAPRGVVVIGNVPTSLLALGTPETIRARTGELIRIARGRKEFIAAPGCDLVPETPLENILAMVNAVRENALS